MRRGQWILLILTLSFLSAPFFINMSPVDAPSIAPAPAELQSYFDRRPVKAPRLWRCRCSNSNCRADGDHQTMSLASAQLRRQCGDDCVADCHATREYGDDVKPSRDGDYD